MEKRKGPDDEIRVSKDTSPESAIRIIIDRKARIEEGGKICDKITLTALGARGGKNIFMVYHILLQEKVRQTYTFSNDVDDLVFDSKIADFDGRSVVRHNLVVIFKSAKS